MAWGMIWLFMHYALWLVGVAFAVLGYVMRDASLLAATNAYSLATSCLGFALLAGAIALRKNDGSD